MDDDDFYGSNYLLDMVQLWQSTGADVFGKPLSYIYSEEDNSLFCREHIALANTVVAAPSPILHGATLAGTVEVARKHPFSHKLAGGEDLVFFEDAYVSGLLMVYADPYNFTCFRSSLEGFHTWRPEPGKFLKRSTVICSGRGEALVNI